MTAPSIEVSVVLVTWNGRELLQQALRSVEACDAEARLEVIVVDNGSTDGTLEMLAHEFPAVRVIANGENLGFARGNNVGVDAAFGEWVLLLNNDAVLEPGAVAILRQTARRFPAFDVVVPQMVTMRDPTIVDNRGIMIDHSCHFRQIDSGRPVASGPEFAEVFGGSGGALMIRRALLQRVPLFDEALGTYLEDADFAVRVRAAGARALYVGAVRVPHLGSATASRLPARKARLLYRNLLVLRRHWMPWRRHWWRSPIVMGYEGYLAAKMVRQGLWGAVRDAVNEAPHVQQRLIVRAKVSVNGATGWIGVRSRPVNDDHDVSQASHPGSTAATTHSVKA